MQRHEHWQHLSRNSVLHTTSTYCNRWASHPRLYRCIFIEYYSRQKTAMYIKVKSQSGTNDGCQIRRHIMG